MSSGGGDRRRLVRLGALGGILLLLGIGVQVLLADGDSGASDLARHETQRFSFSYPAQWDRLEGEEPAAISGSDDYGRHAFGPDRDHVVTVAYVQDLPDRITAGNVEQLIPGYRRIFARFNESLRRGGRAARVLLPPTVTEAAGLPAVESRAASRDERGREIRTRSITIYSGNEQYVVGCRRPVKEDAGTRAADRGCEQVLETLQIEGAG